MTVTIIPDNFVNFAVSQITSGQMGGALFPSDTQMSVRAGDGALFPQQTPFTLVLGPDTITPEIIQVTAIAGDTFTILRGQESTAAQEWAITTTVQQTISAGDMTRLWNSLQTVYNAIPTNAITATDNPTSGDVQLQPVQPSAGTARGLQLGGVDSAGNFHVGLTITSNGVVQGLAAIGQVVSIGSESSPTILVEGSPVGYTTVPTVYLVDDGTFILRGLSQNTEVDFFHITPGSATTAVGYTMGPLSITNNQVYSSASVSLTTTTITPAAPSLALAAGTTLGVGVYQYQVSFVNQDGGETQTGGTSSITTTTNNQNVALSGIPLGPQGTTKRNLYRTLVGGSTFHLLATLTNNTATTYTDSISDASISGTVNPPTRSTFAGRFRILNASGSPLLTLDNDGSITSAAGITLNGTFSADSGALFSNGSGGLTLQAATVNFTSADTALNTDVALAPISASPTAAPSLALTPGTALGIGVYQYVVTYTKTTGFWGETVASPSASITTTSGNQAVTVTLPTNPKGIGGRRLYRTAVGGSTYKLVTTINDNTTTTYTDTTADGSLGSATPVANTFGGVLRIVNESGATQITLSPRGTVTALGALSFDNGGIVSDGSGNLTVSGTISGSVTKINGHTVTVGKTAPSSPALYDIWIQTSF